MRAKIHDKKPDFEERARAGDLRPFLPPQVVDEEDTPIPHSPETINEAVSQLARHLEDEYNARPVLEGEVTSITIQLPTGQLVSADIADVEIL